MTELIFPIIALVLGFGALVFVWKRFNARKQGLLVEDELSNKAAYKAGYYSFFVAIYTGIIAMWHNIFTENVAGFPELDAGQIVGAIVLLSGKSVLWF